MNKFIDKFFDAAAIAVAILLAVGVGGAAAIAINIFAGIIIGVAVGGFLGFCIYMSISLSKSNQHIYDMEQLDQKFDTFVQDAERYSKNRTDKTLRNFMCSSSEYFLEELKSYIDKYGNSDLTQCFVRCYNTHVLLYKIEQYVAML